MSVEFREKARSALCCRVDSEVKPSSLGNNVSYSSSSSSSGLRSKVTMLTKSSQCGTSETGWWSHDRWHHDSCQLNICSFKLRSCRYEGIDPWSLDGCKLQDGLVILVYVTWIKWWRKKSIWEDSLQLFVWLTWKTSDQPSGCLELL